MTELSKELKARIDKALIEKNYEQALILLPADWEGTPLYKVIFSCLQMFGKYYQGGDGGAIDCLRMTSIAFVTHLYLKND